MIAKNQWFMELLTYIIKLTTRKKNKTKSNINLRREEEKNLTHYNII